MAFKVLFVGGLMISFQLVMGEILFSFQQSVSAAGDASSSCLLSFLKVIFRVCSFPNYVSGQKKNVVGEVLRSASFKIKKNDFSSMKKQR